MPQQREKITIRAGETARFLMDLDADEGTPTQGLRGLDYQYTANGDASIMWLPPAARQALIDAGAQAGHEVELTNMRRGSQTIWQAVILEDEPNAEPDFIRQPAPQPKPAPAPKPEAKSNGKANGKAPAAAAASAAAKPAPSPEPQRPGSSVLAGALVTALDAVQYAEDYARAKGRPMQFTTEDVRAMALSLYISADRKGGTN